MLKQRLLTAAVLIPLVLWAVWTWPLPAVMLLYTVVLLLAAWEWGGFLRANDSRRRALWLVGLTATLIPGWWWFQADGAMLPIFVFAAAWWAVALVWLLRYAGTGGARGGPSDAVLVLVGWCVLWPAWMGLLWLQGGSGHGGFWVTFLFVLVWGADTGAYFAGRSLGRHKLAPRVSPGKTWEGVAGGLLAAVVAGLVLSMVFAVPGPGAGLLVLLILVTVALSVVGDLFESLLKRQRGVKDSGTLLPGHGGILDRIDSLTAAAPLLALGLTWWHTTL
ncbi:phosphatidate cytidylyltransferase [Alkalilimnicola ehrlichii MLHE-1]|uniref:Phosphatidate cytidylyltransferase n=1 Tax=Alkalilimnicola ehrlichii (strain ATCC BAA-1101 / DSM 17681 / MLHE-1) TaxID=187272 RepID=Q0A7I5_ALKEH|nr:phosphatidate cytidylyltransferase [Alkalilimnicola ehrlichii]ABI57202.1 phosphatidate cytidylyltransferase [Alkalilimnicola ehrlichii MLHE-1]